MLTLAIRYFHDLKRFGRTIQMINVVALINLLLAFLAFFKDVAIAAYLGTSSYADAYSLAFFIPDMIGNNIFSSAIGIACVPFFAAWHTEGAHNYLRRGASIVTMRVLAASIMLYVLLYVVGGPLLGAIGAGFSPNSLALCLKLYAILTPMVILLPLTMVASAYLQAKESFVSPAFGPVLYHCVGLVVIIILLVIHPPLNQGVVCLAVSILTGVAVNAMFLGLALVRDRNRHKNNKLRISVLPTPEAARIDLRPLFQKLVPYLFILISTELVLAAERWLASRMETGTIAGLHYAYRLAQFPNWVFVAAVTMVMLPAMAKLQSTGDVTQMRAILRRALQLTLLITIPAALILCFGRHPIITLLFGHGSFDARSESITATILAGYSLAIVGQSIAAVYVRLFLTIGRMRIAVIGCFAAAIVNVAFDVWFVPRYGAICFGFGAAVGALVNAIVSAVAAHQYFRHSCAIPEEPISTNI